MIMKNQKQNQIKTKESNNHEEGKTVRTKDKGEIIKTLLKKEDKILIKVINEAIEKTIKNKEMMRATLNKNQIKTIKDTKENNKEVKIIKKIQTKGSQKILNTIQTIIREVVNRINNIQKMLDKMEPLNNRINENMRKILNKIVKINIEDLKLPKIVEVIKIRNLLIRKKIFISKINLIEVEVVIRLVTRNKIVEEETIEELEEGAIEMTLFVIKLTKMLSIQRKILLSNVKIQMIMIDRIRTMVKKTKIQILKKKLTMLIVVEEVEVDEVKMFKIVVVGLTIKRIMQLVKPGSIVNSFRNHSE
jgi:hypothetical protein